MNRCEWMFEHMGVDKTVCFKCLTLEVPLHLPVNESEFN